MTDFFNFDDILTEAAKQANGDYKDSVRLNGVFNVEVSYAQGKTRKKDGTKTNPTVGVKFTVLDGPQAEDEAWFNITLTDKSKAVFGRQLLNMGVSEDFLRSLGSVSDEAGILAALEAIASTLVGAKYNLTVGPNPKSPNFDNWTFNQIIEAPSVVDTAVAPVTAQIPVVPVGMPLVAVAPPAAVPAGMPAMPGFVPPLPQ